MKGTMLHVRLTEEEWASCVARSTEMNMTMVAWVKMRVMESDPPPFSEGTPNRVVLVDSLEPIVDPLDPLLEEALLSLEVFKDTPGGPVRWVCLTCKTRGTAGDEMGMRGAHSLVSQRCRMPRLVKQPHGRPLT